MKLSRIKWPQVLIVASVISLVCVLEFHPVDFLVRMENVTADKRTQWVVRSGPPIATNLVLVPIGERAIKAISHGVLGFSYGLYWPRHVYGRVMKELQLRGALATGCDVMFGEVRRDHATLLLRDGENEEPVSSDELFARYMSEAGNVILGSEEGVIPPALFRTNAMALGDISADRDFDGVLRHAKVFRIYREWNGIFQRVGDDPDSGIDLEKAHIENNTLTFERDPEVGPPLTVKLDKDGNFDVTEFVSRIPKGMTRYMKPFTEARAWHMGIILAARQLKLDLDHPVIEPEKGRITLHGPGGISRVIPVDKNDYFSIAWRIGYGGGKLTLIPFEALLAEFQLPRTPDPNEKLIKMAESYREFDWTNKLVVIGSVATGNDLTDRGQTPLEKDTFLVTKHLNIANQILMNEYVQASPPVVNITLIMGLGVLAAFFVQTFRPYVATIWMVAALLAFLGVAWYAAIKFEYWIAVVLPIGSGILTHGCLLTYLIVFEQQDKRRVTSVFGKMVSPDVVNELLQMPSLDMDAARHKMTVLFADIRGFTEMTDVQQKKADDFVKANNLEGAAAEAVFASQAKKTLETVNRYLELIANEVQKEKGTVDKFIGDCVMAFWGAPLPNKQHALYCVRAAIAAQRAIYNFNLKQAEENRRIDADNVSLSADGKPLRDVLPLLVLGSGINTGVVNVGLMGSDERKNYTVFGREVNLASRLESVSGRARIIISEATLADLIRDDPTLASTCIERESVHVKGIADAIRIYEVPWREVEVAVPSPEFKPIDPAAGDHTGYFVKSDVG